MHITMDNHFLGENVVHLIRKLGYKATMTTRRNRLVAGVDNKYLHHKKVEVSARTRAARFEMPIVLVKEVKAREGDAQDYRVVVVSFQSTGSTNITTVNALKKVGLYVKERTRGRGNRKRKWAIEMNEGRRVYLTNYHAIDKYDQKIKTNVVTIKTSRWWQFPEAHARSMTIVAAHEMYLDCARGNVDGFPEWKLAKPMTGPEWRTKLSRQMCEYDPIYLLYDGDKMFRSVTKVNQSRRGKQRGILKEVPAELYASVLKTM